MGHSSMSRYMVRRYSWHAWDPLLIYILLMLHLLSRLAIAMHFLD